jgi:hypothetical protein
MRQRNRPSTGKKHRVFNVANSMFLDIIDTELCFTCAEFLVLGHRKSIVSNLWQISRIT